MKTISESVVVITGASSGIARATAYEVARQKGTVVLASRQEAALVEVARECERMGAHALAVKTDVTDEEQVRNLARKAIENYGRIDAWVNAAAVTMLSRFEESPPEAFRRVIETNFFGYVHGARAVLPHFRQQGYGVLVNIASVVGKIGSPYASAYVASKFAITGFSESLRMELRDMPDIHVCTILPATIDTPLFQHAANFTGRVVQAMPPVYKPEMVAEAVVGCLQKPRREVPVGNTRRMITMRRLAPPLAERIIASKVHKQHFRDEPAPASRGNVFDPMPQFNSIHGGWARNNAGGRRWIMAALAAGIGIGFFYWFGRRRPSYSGETIAQKLARQGLATTMAGLGARVPSRAGRTPVI